MEFSNSLNVTKFKSTSGGDSEVEAQKLMRKNLNKIQGKIDECIAVDEEDEEANAEELKINKK